SIATGVHFGLGAKTQVKSVEVRWPDGTISSVNNVATNQRIFVAQASAIPKAPAPRKKEVVALLEAAPSLTENFSIHKDSLFIDFNVQPLLPHKLSEYGPGLAVSDVNGDGLQDIYRSGSHFNHGQLLVQSLDESGHPVFSPSDGLSKIDKGPEELASLFFDADQDGDQDLYLVSGGSEFSMDRSEYQDRLLLNDGQGQFSLASDALPNFLASGSCVRAADFDLDGDLDLFVGGRLKVATFPQAVDSYLLINNGKGQFTQGNAPALEKIGLVCDALWTDYDGDGWQDLLIAGQGMPLTVIKNDKGELASRPIALLPELGWWNSLVSADFDLDGDLDYLVGNFGQNHLYHQDGEDFVALYGGDFDGNGGFDLITADRTLDAYGVLRVHPHFQRSDTEKQLVAVKSKYPRHVDFGQVTMEQFLQDFPVEGLTTLTADYLSSAWIENQGTGNYQLHKLPPAAQMAPLFGAQSIDVNGDAYPDVVAVGNDFGTEVGMGRLDGLNGLVLLFDPAEKNFQVVSLAESGMYVPGNGRSLVLLPVGSDHQPTIIAAENQGKTRAYQIPGHQLKWYPVDDKVTTLSFQLPDGKRSVLECSLGSGFLSQNAQGAWLPVAATDIQEVRPEAATK
ncbi:MAG: FG-GAP-like repeat-containing protein, partial [Bacteroidota bacterium]